MNKKKKKKLPEKRRKKKLLRPLIKINNQLNQHPLLKKRKKQLVKKGNDEFNTIKFTINIYIIII